ncbi:hypothetical protein SDRG_07804 [Saprolegnia diclina VS20]|uniref:Uncharacterized protein n=1 Tax=Saprolegnia diclina (strain VS20) TaxID=1156394 RepID=T0QID6_SAPDV|nr:hypothetical protein SDRG_07804 [Saprolegnia diclina VS20]EQC34476.1 hypothetical protein SDRG_07804 [Saprolegnia diclina VS20]|eukprot:XP_008611882.1 hypothetical protein SDRG_07804 [Saprolegnia diclina VS20]
MAKRTKMTLVLMPEVVERVATCIVTSKDMAAFLQALPEDWLSEPLAALRQLYRAVQTRRLKVLAGDKVYPRHVRLWPHLELPYEIHDEELCGWIVKAMVLYPTVAFDSNDLPPSYPLQPQTQLKVHAIETSELLQEAISRWPERIQLLELLFVDASEWPRAKQVAASLTTLPALREVIFQYEAYDIKYNFSPMFQALASTRVRDVKVLNVHTVWPKAADTALAKWLRTGSIAALTLDGDFVLPNEFDSSAICKGIAASKTLVDVEIKSTPLLQLFFREIPVLPPHLRSLSLQGLSLDDLALITAAIAPSQLQKIQLGFDPGYDDEFPNETLALVDALSHLRSLRQCHLFGIQLSGTDVTRLASLLPQLTTLHLEAAGLDDDKVAILAAALPQCSSLELLHLSHQDFGDAGVASLAAVVPQCPSLKTLNLNENLVTDKGVQALCPIVHHLDAINLSYNTIDVDGALAISHIIPETCHMTRICLHGNRLRKEGVLAIISALGDCVYRQGFVNVYDTVFDDDDAIEEAIEELPDAAWIIFDDDSRTESRRTY